MPLKTIKLPGYEYSLLFSDIVILCVAYWEQFNYFKLFVENAVWLCSLLMENI